jgi:hypothetical protein
VERKDYVGEMRDYSEDWTRACQNDPASLVHV